MYPIALHLASYCRIALLVLIAHFLFVCVFGSSRVDTDTEQYEQEYEHTPQVDPACTTTADLTGEPLLFTYFTFQLSLLLLSLCCDSFRVTCPIPPVYPNKPCIPSITYRPLFVVCKPCEW